MCQTIRMRLRNAPLQKLQILPLSFSFLLCINTSLHWVHIIFSFPVHFSSGFMSPVKQTQFV